MEKPTTIRMSTEDRHRLQTLAVLFKTQTEVIHRGIALMWAEYSKTAENVARIVGEERKTMRTRWDKQEKLFDMFVAHSTTNEEVAAMDLITLTRHIHELREGEPDEIPMSDSMVASAIQEFARDIRQEAQERVQEFPSYTDAQGNEHAEY